MKGKGLGDKEERGKNQREAKTQRANEKRMFLIFTREKEREPKTPSTG